MADVLFKDESYRIMGACFEVYKVMGSGFVEPVYQECLELELASRDVPFQAQAELALNYKGTALKCKFVPDFIVFDQILLEIKAVAALDDVHRAQVHNYIKATGIRLGLLVNFGSDRQVEYERIVK